MYSILQEGTVLNLLKAGMTGLFSFFSTKLVQYEQTESTLY